MVASMSGALNVTWAGVTRGVVVIERSSSHFVWDTRAVIESMLVVFVEGFLEVLAPAGPEQLPQSTYSWRLAENFTGRC